MDQAVCKLDHKETIQAFCCHSEVQDCGNDQTDVMFWNNDSRLEAINFEMISVPL